MKLVVRIEADDNETLTPELINKFNSLEKEVFSDYIIDSNLPALKAALNESGLKGGQLNIQYDQTDNVYYTVVEYKVKKPLNMAAEKELITYTLSQISDGIGDNVVQDFQEKYNIFVYLKLPDSNVVVTYIDEPISICKS